MMRNFFALILLCASVASQAKENITIIYAYNIADSVANYHRALTIESNAIQDKYLFIFDARPGAGGTIASNYVLNTPNTILAHSTAFFIRPNVYPKESYDLSLFKELFNHCTASMAVTSAKYKSWKEVPAKTVTVGISGLGVTTHLAALQLQKNFPNMDIIPFKSTTDSMFSMIGANTDFHIGFISEAEQWTKKDKDAVNILGITGTKAVSGYPTLVSEGFPQAFGQMDVGHHLVVPVGRFSEEKARELYDIFSKAAKAKSVRDAYAVDFCKAAETPYSELQKWYSFHTEYWKKLSAGINLESVSK
jgi:tripartite-type tricarboxylate transporter receptor subunit TctC